MFILQIDYQKTSSPASIGLDGGDMRELAVFFHSLRLEYRGGDVSVDFSSGGKLGDVEICGFWRPESEGRWSAGRRSLIVFGDSIIRQEIQGIEIEASAFRAAFKMCQVDLSTTGGLRGHLRIAKRARRHSRLCRPWFRKPSYPVFGDISNVDGARNVSRCHQQPMVSLIIPNHERGNLTRLSAIAAASSRIDVPFEMICMDNGSSINCLSAIGRAEVPMRVIEFGSNIGFGEACNKGAQAARGQYLLFLNNDAFLRPGAVNELLQAFDAKSNCGAAGAVLLNIDGALQEAGCTLRDDGTALRHGRDDREFRRDALPRFQEVDYVSGACLMIRKEEFLEAGGFDSIYSPAYYEDTDFCMRLREMGKAVFLASRAECYHIENATSNMMESADWATQQSEKNRQIFLERWGKRLSDRCSG